MTVEEAALKWGLSKRMIQHLCKTGKVEGATRFNRNWSIPKEAAKPSKNNTDNILPSMKPIPNPSNHLLSFADFERIMDQCPYSMHISKSDGTMVFANSLFMEGVLEEARSQVIGNFNIFSESQLEAWGLKDHVFRAFKGERVTTKGLKFPNKELVNIRYGKEYAFVNIYQDITSFPIFSPDGKLSFVVTLFIPSEKHYERYEIMAAKAYIDAHWKDALCNHDIAKSVSLSVSRLTHLFKAETGFTLHDYYNDIKMRHICDMLTNPDLMVSEVFSLCGVAYNSHYSSLFKAYTGMSPRQYRTHKKTL